MLLTNNETSDDLFAFGIYMRLSGNVVLFDAPSVRRLSICGPDMTPPGTTNCVTTREGCTSAPVPAKHSLLARRPGKTRSYKCSFANEARSLAAELFIKSRDSIA